MDFGHQKYYLEQVKKHQKSILVWFRQSGKSSLIIESIENYVFNNTGKIVHVYTQDTRNVKELLKKSHKRLKINNLSSTQYLNNNVVKFKTNGKYEDIKPDFIIYDDFEFIKDADIFSNLIDIVPKVLLTSSQFTTELITYFDRHGDYYLGVVSASSALSDDKILERKKVLPSGAYNIAHEYGNIEELYSGLGIEKDRNLIDVWGIRAQRRKKLEEISKKIKENNEN